MDYNLLVFLIIFGVACLFMCVYAVARLSGNVNTEERNNISDQQLEYMREVHQRHVNALEMVAKSHR